MFGSRKRIEYKEYAEGIWGEFSTASGRVNFLMTRARLGKAGDMDRDVRLTSLLSPVREALDIKQLDFGQLLQRDLDDHRVAIDLVPYLMENKPTGPAFFPPILAVLLPFDGTAAAEHFPALEVLENQEIEEFEGSSFHESRYGSAFRFQRMVAADGSDPSVRFARLSWNTESARLVVLDGQHRAMALIAVQRTISNSWRGSTGEKYRYFYEHEIQRLMESGGDGVRQKLASVEFPVTLVWFPEMHGHGQRPHVAARKLFVDVNKNARLPSKSRLVLLSDNELLDIFTRDLLNRLRKPAAPFPLFAVEFDNPDVKSHRPARWSVFTNLMMLRDLVERAVFGPGKYIIDVRVGVAGRPSESEMNKWMRDQLRLSDILPSEIDEGEQNPSLSLEELKNDNFPQHNKGAREQIEARFMEVWGEAILHVLGHFRPWRKHVEAIEAVERGWVTEDTVSGLAKDALFEGVGKFWTLRDTAAHWRERVSQGKASDSDVPEIVKAWRLIDRDERSSSKYREFIARRAGFYLERTDAESIRRSEDLYGSVNTYACQLGAILTVATLRYYNSALSPQETAEICVKAWNAAIEDGPSKSRNRRLLLSRGEERPLNMLGKMDSPDAIYYRYFFLQLLCSEEARPHWEGFFDADKLASLTSDARSIYVNYLIAESAKALKRTKPTAGDAVRIKEATAQVKTNLGDALKHWFKINKPEFDDWFRDRDATAPTPQPVSELESAQVDEEASPESEFEQLFSESDED